MPTDTGIQHISTDKANPPGGHYSQATVHSGTVYVSGQLAFTSDPDKGARAPVDMQTERCLDNIGAILEAAGSSLDAILKLTIFVARMEHWPVVNEVVARVFGDTRPARLIVPCGDLHYGFQVEIDAIAAVVKGE